MKLTDHGLDLIKSHEGLRLNAYPDPATGGDPWTIGYGHTSRAGPPPVRPGMSITRAQAEEILKSDLRKFEAEVQRMVKVPLNDNQYSALVSFCFNVGPGNLQKSGVLRAVNAKQFGQVPSRLMQWNKAAGKVMKGLTRRRAEEGRLFITPAGESMDDDAPDSHVPDKPVGKPILKSKTVWAQIIQIVTGGGAAALTALGEIPWQNALILAGTVIILAGGYIIYSRWQKSVNEGI
jgi:lysozyme